ncbi:MAG: amidohydrolase [Lentisphaeria bacterium]|nr:amidohydrolase [Lentisphaeria bacterium]
MSIPEEKYLAAIDRNRSELLHLASGVWGSPEVAFHEERSAARIKKFLKKNGFEIEENVAGIPTAFVGSFGSGKPEVGFIAEYDALADMSQQPMMTRPVKLPGEPHGHGCGHHLYCGGAVAAALAVKEYLTQTGKPGTVKLLGCPGEEGGSGKAYMARAGVFSHLDAVFGGHPESMWAVRTRGSLACCTVRYKFDGRAAHAGTKAHLGRSALDALELMNVAVNFLREHMPLDNRVHYAIMDAGGRAPNVVQPHAEVLYMMRGKDNASLKALCRRVDLCAQGAALATETEMSSEFESGSSNLITIPTLQRTLHQAMLDLELPTPTAEETQFARELIKTMPDRDPELPLYADRVLPIPDTIAPHFGSTDTGDVSWNCPTVQMHVGSWIVGTPGHSWQAVTQGLNGFALRAMLYAGKAQALAAIRVMEDPDLVAAAHREHLERTGGKYDPALPPDVMPKL